MFNRYYKVANLHREKFRGRFEIQKQDEAFRRWKKNRWLRQGKMCFYCHQVIAFQGSNIEHLVPLHRGGTNKRSNLVVSCWKCNKDKGVQVFSQDKILELRQSLNKKIKLLRESEHASLDEEQAIIEHLRSI